MLGSRVSYFSFAAGLGLLLAAGYLATQPGDPTPAWEVEEAVRVFDALPADKKETVEFIVHNRTNRTIRVIGTLIGSCSYNCDFRVKTELPFDVPPGASAPVVFSLIPLPRADTFHHTVPLYLDDGALREVTLSVEGKVLPRLPDS